MLKTYDYWLFYKKSDNELYAYTDDKELYKLFKHQRNMKLFYYKKQELTKEDVRELTEEAYDRILSECELKYSENGKPGSIKMVITTMEKLSVMNESADLIACDIYTYAWINPYIFKKDIIKSLKILKYIDCYNIVSKEGDLKNLDIFSEADELALFLRYYGNTL